MCNILLEYSKIINYITCQEKNIYAILIVNLFLSLCHAKSLLYPTFSSLKIFYWVMMVFPKRIVKVKVCDYDKI